MPNSVHNARKAILSYQLFRPTKFCDPQDDEPVNIAAIDKEAYGVDIGDARNEYGGILLALMSYI